MPRDDSHVYMADDLANLMIHAETFGDTPLFVNEHESLSFRSYGENVRKILSGLVNLDEPYLVLNIKDQLLLAEAWMASALSGHTVCLLPEGMQLPETLSSAPILDDEKIRFLCHSGKVCDYPIQNPDQVCTIAFSSGTSSKPRGVMLSQKNMLLDTEYSMHYYHFYKGMRLVHVLPFWHMFGLAADLLAPLHAGSVLYIPGRMREMEALSVFKPHSINASPAFADAMVRLIQRSVRPEKVTGGCLERIVCGGAPYSAGTEQKLMDYGILPCTGYGLTECSPCISITRGNEIHIGTAGRPLECLKIFISKNGEILVSGNTVMKGYFEDETATQERIRDGWFHTGDLGFFDKDGNLVITGRLSSMLVLSNGKKCLPEPVEAKICELAEIYESTISLQNGHIVLKVSSSLPEEEIRKLTEPIMKENGLLPYIIRKKANALNRNRMGKLIR